MAPSDDPFASDGDAAKPAEPKKKGKGIGLFIIIGLVVMIGTPTATYFVVQHATPPSADSAPRRPPPTEKQTVMSIDPLTVNISGTRMSRILRMQVHLVLSEPRLEGVLEEMMPMVKDRIMTTASRRTLDELEDVVDRESLKRDIAMQVNSLVQDRMSGSVVDVAFSEFLIQ